MQHEIIIGIIVLMAVLKPVAAADMQFYMAGENGVANLYSCILEIGTGMGILLSRLNHSYRLSFSCFQSGSIIQAVLPDKL